MVNEKNAGQQAETDRPPAQKPEQKLWRVRIKTTTNVIDVRSPLGDTKIHAIDMWKNIMTVVDPKHCRIGKKYSIKNILRKLTKHKWLYVQHSNIALLIKDITGVFVASFYEQKIAPPANQQK